MPGGEGRLANGMLCVSGAGWWIEEALICACFKASAMNAADNAGVIFCMSTDADNYGDWEALVYAELFKESR